MKNILYTIILSFLFSSVCLAGDIQEDYDGREIQNSNTKVVDTLERRNDLAYEVNTKQPFTGKYIIYYKNGIKKQEIDFKDGKYHGYEINWHENGQIQSKLSTKNGKKEGLYLLWDINGQKRSEGNFKNGKEDGSWLTWYANGKMKNKINYKNGRFDGLAVSWYENGQKKSESNYKAELLNYRNGTNFHGRVTQWDENGRKTSEGNYRNGERVSADFQSVENAFQAGKDAHDAAGVPDKESAKWYLLAAEQGHIKAQLNLSVMYWVGHGVIQDIVIAHMWANIAAIDGSENAKKMRNQHESKMSSEQIAKAQELARKCIKKNYKDCG